MTTKYKSRVYTEVSVTDKLCLKGKLHVISNEGCGRGLVVDTLFETNDPLFACQPTVRTDSVNGNNSSEININSVVRFATDTHDVSPTPRCNTKYGYHALNSAITTSSSTAYGYNALLNNQSGNRNTAFGKNAMRDTISCNDNFVMSVDSMSQTTDNCNRNVLAGRYVWTELGVIGNDNILIQNNDDPGTPGANLNENTVIGYRIFEIPTTANRNVAFGGENMTDCIDGQSNVCIGTSSGRLNENGSYNTCFGSYSNQNNGLDGNYNCMFGTACGTGEEPTSESRNIYLGAEAGRNIPNVTTNIDYNDNIFIGHLSGGYGFQSRFKWYCRYNLGIGYNTLGARRGITFNLGYYDNVIAIGTECLSYLFPPSNNVGEDYYLLASGINAARFYGSIPLKHTICGGETGGGSNSCAFGYENGSETDSINIGAFVNNTSFNNQRCVIIGYDACNVSGSGTDCVWIGSSSNPINTNNHFAIGIGSNSQASQNNIAIGYGTNSNGSTSSTVIGTLANNNGYNRTICLGNLANSTRSDEISLTPGYTLATSANAGSGPAIPAAIYGYLVFNINGIKYGAPVYQN